MWFKSDLLKGVTKDETFYVHVDCIYEKARKANSLKEIEVLERIHVINLDIYKEKFLKWTGYRAKRRTLKISSKFFKPRTRLEKKLWKPNRKPED